MESRSRARRCLGIVGLSATLVVGSQAVGLLGAASAFAATSGLAITSQSAGNASTADDGTNSSIRISAFAYNGDSSDVTRVEFSVKELTPVPAPAANVVGTDTSAPYGVDWSGAVDGTYEETAKSYDAANNVLATASKTVTVSTTAGAVHIVRPSDGGSIGVFTGAGTLAAGGTIAVNGTRSAGNPALAVNARTTDSSTGVLGVAGADTTIAAGTNGNADDQQWHGVVTVPAGADAGNVVVAARTANGSSDEVMSAVAYKQVLSGITTPADQKVTGGSDATFVVNATDTHSLPVAGLTVTAQVTDPTGGAAATPTTQSTKTDGAGNATFTVTAGTNGTSTLVFRTEVNGSSYDVNVDATSQATLNYLDPVATGLSFVVRPQKDVYATSNSGTGEYTSSLPVVDVCITDETGQPLPAAGTGPTNLILSDVRSVDGVASASTTPTRSADPANGFRNCYIVAHAAHDGTYGSDAFGAYLETNHKPGQQSDEMSATTTTKWADLGIAGADTQGAKGADVTGSFVVTGADGSPFAARTINLVLTGGTDATFPDAGQPDGTAPSNGTNTAATCTTTATGVCSYVLTEPANGNGVESVTVTANDTTTSGAQIATGATATEEVRFADTAPTLTTAQSSSETVIAPGGTYYFTAGEPGTVIEQQVQLLDADNNVLANVPVTASTDHGFFTDVPADGNYAPGVSFDPAATNGAAVGKVATNGTTFTGTTDDQGYLTYALGIGRDSAFDQNGEVLSTVSLTVAGTTLPTAPDTSSAFTWSTDSNDLLLSGTNTPLNPGAVAMVPAGISTTLTGITKSDFDVDGPTFAVHLSDQFGNLVRDADQPATLAASGPASLAESSDTGSYLDAAQITAHVVANAATSTVASNATITASWQAATSVFDASLSDGVDGSGTATSTDSFTVAEYLVDRAGLQLVRNDTPDDIVRTGTSVRDQVTITDQLDRPVRGLYVTFGRSGPGSVDSRPNQVVTGTGGTASYTFSSAVQGNATVTVDVYDCDTVNDAGCSADAPLAHDVHTIGFDAVPTLTTTNRTGPGTVTVSGTTRPGAGVQLYQRRSGAAAFTKVGALGTAGVTGRFTFTPAITTTTAFEVRVDALVASATVTSKVSDPIEQPKVSLSSQATGILGIGVVTNPTVTHKIIRVYSVAADGTRTIIARVSSGATGRIFTRVKLTSGRTYTIQAYVVSPTGYVSTYSTPVLRKVK